VLEQFATGAADDGNLLDRPLRVADQLDSRAMQLALDGLGEAGKRSWLRQPADAPIANRGGAGTQDGNVVGRLPVRGGLAHRRAPRLYAVVGADHLEPPFADLFALALLADSGIGLFAAEEGAGAAQAEAALAVLANVAGTGGEQRVGHLRQVG